MILVATLLCDRKKSSQLIAIKNIAALTHQDILIYVNIETSDLEGNFADLLDFLQNCGRPYHIDTWQFNSTWHKRPTFDQDQARLFPIVIARNMSLEAAFALGASHIFQVDADVLVPPDSIERLLAIGRPVVSGLVPGRGAHACANYLFHIQGTFGRYIECSHATCGFTLIERKVFEVIRYRVGPHPIHRETILSEDPAFGADFHCIWGYDWWTVDMELKAQHWDDPNAPMSWDQGSQF